MKTVIRIKVDLVIQKTIKMYQENRVLAGGLFVQ
jgi:hypothetical protein